MGTRGDVVSAPRSGVRHVGSAGPDSLREALERAYSDAVLWEMPAAQVMLGAMLDGLRVGLGVKAPHAAFLRRIASVNADRFPGTQLARVYERAVRAIDTASTLELSSRRPAL